jgi:sugar lactone lactonase YvrE
MGSCRSIGLQKAELLLDVRNAVGESPVWIAQEQALYWVDIPQRNVLRCSASDHALTRWMLPEQVGCIAPARNGGWVCGLESGVAHVVLGAEGRVCALEMISAPRHPAPAMRFNDGRCDRQGRFRASTMYTDMAAARALGALYALDADRGLTVVLDGLLTPNGLAFSPDGRTMYLSDSHPRARKIWAFDYDAESGRPSAQRLFVDMNEHPGRPDGAAVDVEGCYWTCANDAGLVHRFTPTGKLDRSIVIPASKPAMCAFGGADFRSLYVTSIRPKELDPADESLAGSVFAVSVDCPGLAEKPWNPHEHHMA